ncbi:unnamed protein product, partial [Rangifer tarandus platyrhynchus]
ASSQGLGGGAPGVSHRCSSSGAQPPLARTLPRGASFAARTAGPPGVSENCGEGGGSEALQATGGHGNPVSTSLNGRKQAPQSALPGPGTCVSLDSSLQSVRQEPSFGSWKGSPFLQQMATLAGLCCN